MRREISIHLSFLISFFIFISLFRGWLDVSFWPLWLGGLIGTVLPDLDHLIYVYFLRPHELTSQRVERMVRQARLSDFLRLLAETRGERTKLIFHTLFFQLIFLGLTFLVITSSASLLGRGLVLAFSLHLLIDQIVNLVEMGSLGNWFGQIPFSFSEEGTRGYLFLVSLVILFFGFFL